MGPRGCLAAPSRIVFCCNTCALGLVGLGVPFRVCLDIDNNNGKIDTVNGSGAQGSTAVVSRIIALVDHVGAAKDGERWRWVSCGQSLTMVNDRE